jgi:Tfp pilus assembly protein PilN
VPAKSLHVNLAPKDEFEQSLIGRILKWALTAGKSIVILTEFVVILAFLSRFKLDVDLNDLDEVIIQKQAIIESYAQVEADMRNIQSRVGVLETVNNDTIGVREAVNNLASKLPNEIFLESLTIEKNSIQLKGGSTSEAGLASLIEAYRTDDNFATVTVGEINFNQRKAQVEFTLRAEKTLARTPATKTAIIKAAN